MFHVKHLGGAAGSPGEQSPMYPALTVFEAYAASAGLTLSEEQRNCLLAGAQWLACASAATALSQYRDVEDVLLRAMGPALAYFACQNTPRSGVVADLGSGNGAIGATIALLAPDLEIHLVDRARRAYTASELLVARMGLKNARPLQADLKGLTAIYDAAAFRALAPGADALGAVLRLVKQGGVIGAYHRPDDTAYAPSGSALRPLSTVATTVDDLVLTCYRR